MAKRKSLLDLLDETSPEAREAFLRSIENLTSDVRLSTLVSAIEGGDVQRALEELNIRQEYFAPLDKALSEGFQQGGEWVFEEVKSMARGKGARVKGFFDARNPQAEEYIRTNIADLTGEIAQDMRQTAQDMLSEGIQSGRNPRRVGLDLIGRVNRATGKREGGVIGLTSQQKQWAADALDELQSGSPSAMRKYLGRKARDKRFDRTVKKAIKAKEALDAETARKIAARYHDGLMRYRGEVIARTEMHKALNASQQQGLDQLVQSGQVQGSAIKRIWDASEDSDTRSSHRAMDGQERGLNETFLSGAGNALRYPGDPKAPLKDTAQCRCRLDIDIDFLSELGPGD